MTLKIIIKGFIIDLKHYNKGDISIKKSRIISVIVLVTLVFAMAAMLVTGASAASSSLPSASRKVRK